MDEHKHVLRLRKASRRSKEAADGAIVGGLGQEWPNSCS